MSIFDKLKKSNASPSIDTPKAQLKKETFTFEKLPESLDELLSMPQAKLDSPYGTAALTVIALCVYAAEKSIGIDMLNYLRGPRPLSNFDISFIDDRLRDGKHYVPFSYFDGTCPENDYTPSTPYSITIDSNQYSLSNPGYMKLIIKSSGADTPRELQLRMTSDGKWYLWEQFLLPDIRPPKSNDIWT